MVRVKNVSEMWKRFLTEVKPFIKPVLILFGIYALGMIAIIRANFSYVDDLARAAEGYKGWGNFSRYLSNFLAIFVNGNTYLTDISPWPQLLGCFVMAVAGVLLLYIIYDRKKFRWWELVSVVPLALNPYFLGCLSYKFDAPFIALSVLFSVLPLVFRKKRAMAYVGATMFGVLCSCMTYQASLGVLPLVTILLGIRMWSQKGTGKEIGGFLIKTVVGYVVGILFFKVFFMNEVDSYVTTATPGLGGLVPNVFRNLEHYYQLIWSDLTGIWKILIGVVVIGFVFMFVMRAKQRKWLAGVLAIAGLVVMGVVCFGIYPLLTQPLYEVRAMYGFFVMVSLLCVVVTENWEKVQRWQGCVWRIAVSAVVVLAYVFGIFGLTYGNALALQKEWTEFRTELVIQDLEEVIGEKEGVSVGTVGVIGLAPALERAGSRYPVLVRMIPIEFGAGYWGQYRFFRYYGLRGLERDLENIPTLDGVEMVLKNDFHEIGWKNDAEVVIKLEKAIDL